MRTEYIQTHGRPRAGRRTIAALLPGIACCSRASVPGIARAAKIGVGLKPV